MLNKVLYLFALVALLGTTTVIQAQSADFSVNAFYDAMVANDDTTGPDQSLGGTGLHVRDIPARRRVALISWDISAIKDERATLEGVTLSIIAASGGTVNVYGVIEELDNIGGDLTWNTAPGVQNDPAPAVGDPVALDLADLTDMLLTISDIPGGSSTRVSSEPSQALTDFLDADTDGTITLLFAPPEGGKVILRSAVRWNNPLGGTFLEGSSVLPTGNEWLSGASGDFDTPSAWSEAAVPDGNGTVANFSTRDLVGATDVTFNTHRTLGHLLFGDTALETAGVVGLFGVGALTLADDDFKPTITANTLTPLIDPIDPNVVFDDSFLGVLLAGTNGFRKLGPGILTIGNTSAEAFTGTVDIEGGTLRVAPGGQLRGPTINLHDGATYETSDNWNQNPFITVEAGASANLIANRANNTVVRRLSGGGEGTSLNITTFAPSDKRFELQTATPGIDNWTMNNGDPNSTIWFSPLYNGSTQVSTNWVEDGALVLNGVNMATRKSGSGGKNVSIGSLSSDALSGISGGDNNAGTVRYEIGSLNTDTEFAGVIQFARGKTGMSIDKVGTGTLTLSGSQNLTMVKDNANIDLNGGVVRVSEGTLALTNTFDHFVGGTAFTPSMIDVKEGASLDVSGVNGTYYSSDMQQLQGSGTIVGNYIHSAASGFDPDGNADAIDDAGTILPGNVSAVGNLTELTSWSVPTAGTLTFDGDLQLDGGSIAFDVSQDPASGSDLIHVTGTTALNAGTISLNYLAGAPTGGTYTLITSDGGFTGSAANITIALPGRGTAPTPTIVGNDLVFTQPADAASGDLTWVSGSWDVQTSASWNDGSGADIFYNGDNVTFDATGNHNVDLAGFVSPSSVVIDSALPYSFTGWGAIMGSGSLVKNGTGDLKMHVLNGFTGDAIINGGDVDIDRNNGALGFGNLQINSDTTISSDGWDDGEKGQLDNGSITIAAGATLTMEVHSGRNRSGAFFLTDIGGEGNLILSVTHNQKYYRPVFSGFTGNLAVFPYGGATVTGLRLNEGGTRLPDSIVDLTGTIVQMGDSVNDALIEFGELHGDAGTVLAAAETGNPGPPGWNTTYKIGALGTDSDFAGTIQDDGFDAPGCCTEALAHLTKVGAGTLTLIGSEKNTYTGDTTVEAGTLSIDAAYLADTADVVLTTGAVLDLNFAGTDTIGSLLIDGVPQATGVWGDVGSGAANETPLLTGSGSLLVTVQ